MNKVKARYGKKRVTHFQLPPTKNVLPIFDDDIENSICIAQQEREESNK